MINSAQLTATLMTPLWVFLELISIKNICAVENVCLYVCICGCTVTPIQLLVLMIFGLMKFYWFYRYLWFLLIFDHNYFLYSNPSN